LSRIILRSFASSNFAAAVLRGASHYFMHPSAWKGNSRNFAMKLSEKSHERARHLAIRRVIAA
jgi:hypothetical protein